MITAEKFMDKFLNEEDLKPEEKTNRIWVDCAIDTMKAFAQYHVKLALEKAAKGCIDIHHEIADLPQNCNDYEEAITQYIENIYSLENIK